MPTSYWHETSDGGAPATASGDLPPRCDVVVVGAGIAGLTIAEELARRGRRVVVLEHRRIAAGTTGASTAKVSALHGAPFRGIRALHGAPFRGIRALHGDRGARYYATANLLGVEHLRTTVAALGQDVGWFDAWASTYTTDPDRVADLDDELAAATAAGIPLTRADPAALPPGGVTGIRLDAQAAVDPVRLAGALAGSLAARGQPVRDGVHVADVTVDEPMVVHTDRGRVQASHVVIATLGPVVDPLALFARESPTMSYSLAARLASPLPDGLHLSIDEPARSVRPLVPGSPIAIFGGGGHRVGEGGDTREHRDELRAWVEANYPMVRIEAQWSAHDLTPTDLVPFIGRTGDDDRLLVATGFGKWGFSHAGAAALLVAGLLESDEPEWAPLFDPRRAPSSVAAAARTVQANVTVGAHLVADKARTLAAPSADSLAPGEGGIVRIDGTKVAAFRRGDGTLVTRSATCTHLGCQVAWNAAENTWDCPCHGSRFAPDGAVLAAPALRALGAPGDDDGSADDPRGGA